MTSGLRQVGAKQLFVEDTEGDKPAVVFIHGLGGTTTFYDPLVSALGELYRLVRFDFEGGRWVELAVDSKTAQVVRVRRSR